VNILKTKKRKFLPYGIHSICNDDVEAVSNALVQEYITSGQSIELFEQKLSKLTSAKYAVVCSNGTAALHLACLATGLQKGDVAIVPSVSFLATANAVRYCGAEVLFADVCPKTGLMTSETYEEAIAVANSGGLKVKAVLPVHLTGTPVELKKIYELSKNQNIKIVADSCHAIGGSYLNKPIGACIFEDLATFSFHPVKTVTSGEGGAVTTNDLSAANKMKALRSHNMNKSESMFTWEYEMHELGFNYRINDFQCALGISQLKKLGRFVKKRQALVAIYDKALSAFWPVIRTRVNLSNRKDIAPHLYSILIDFSAVNLSRQQVIEDLEKLGVGTQVHYIPIHTQPYYEKRYGKVELKGAKKYYGSTLSLPLFPLMEPEDVNYVVWSLKKVLGI
tara:strand:+ start:973 stop:2151 length:1179 start_codon:yes stop_codon:yes gene_type:complete